MEIVTALASMKAGIELATLAWRAHDEARMQQALGDLSAQFAEAQMAALTMSERLRTKETELLQSTAKLRAAEERLAKREKYRLAPVAQGVFAYAYEPLGDDSTPAHHQCQVCFDAGESSVLVLSTNGRLLICKRDKAHTLQIKDPSVGFVPSHNPFARD